MFKLNPKQFLIKEPTIYEIKAPNVTFERRQELLTNLIGTYPRLTVRGGTTKTNPYKIHYDLVLAERRELYEYYKNSILWSPKFTPWQFKYLWVYPCIFVAFLLWYLRYIAMPKRLLYLKTKYGVTSEELEAKGWLVDWESEEELEDDDQFKQMYTQWTMKDIQKFEKDAQRMMDKMGETKPATKSMDSLSAKRSLERHFDIQEKLEKIYKDKKTLGHNIS